MITPQKAFNLFNGFGWDRELPLQHAPQFFDHYLACHKLVFRTDKPQHIGTEAPCAESAGEDVCVRKHSHETDLKTSSSVKYPRASANGITRRRNCSKRSCVRWRFNASRITSLRVCPER